jgi:hypothetical protein
MKFDSASELKQHAKALLSGRSKRPDRRDQVGLAHFALLSDDRAMPASAAIVGLGISQKPERPDEFQLAVRYRHASDPGTEETVARLSELAHGEIDAQETGDIRLACWHRAPQRPCCIGTSVGPSGVNGAGTLGAFVKRADDDALYLLSNNHVLTNQHGVPVGTPILQPGGYDSGNSSHRIAELSDWIPVALGDAQVNQIDAAIARLDPDVRVAEDHLEHLGSLAGVTDARSRFAAGERVSVYKVGRTTFLTSGYVTAVDIEITTSFAGQVARFEEQIEIAGHSGMFGDLGDSGSLVVDDRLQGTGLFFAVGARGQGYANHLAPVLNAMRIQLAI